MLVTKFGSGTFWLHTMMFQTSTNISVCMSICLGVCLGACLHPCMYMSRTHTTHIHAHTTHTQHNNDFSTRLLFHQIFFKVGPKHLNQVTRTNQHLRVISLAIFLSELCLQHSWHYMSEVKVLLWSVNPQSLLLCLVLFCTNVYVLFV